MKLDCRCQGGRATKIWKTTNRCCAQRNKTSKQNQKMSQIFYDPELYRNDKFFYKILDIRIVRYPDAESLRERVEQKWNDFCELVDFLRRIEEPGLKRVMYKAQGALRQQFEVVFPWYKQIDSELQKKYVESVKVGRLNFSARHNHKKFIVFDICKANFTCLIHCNNLLRDKTPLIGLVGKENDNAPESWADFFLQLVPEYDQRSQNLKRKVFISSQGPCHKYPSCFLKSKFVRTFLLSNFENYKLYGRH